jgi:hypothetical protein
VIRVPGVKDSRIRVKCLKILESERSSKSLIEGSQGVKYSEPVEELIFFRLIKNAQMQGARNPEE